MSTLAIIVIGFVAIQHLAFLVLEMFLWTKPVGLKVFRNSPSKAQQTAALAANQGLYNGFLAAGLVWALVSTADSGSQIAIFFLSCVVIAGIYGAYSVSVRILPVQALPAAAGLLAVVLS